MLKQILEKMNEEDLSPLQKQYRDYFSCMMKKYGVDSPADFKDDETKRKFFNDVSVYWKVGVGPQKDSPCK